MQKLFQQEINRFQTFLNTQNAPDKSIDEDVVYVCIGHGVLADQIWPGFVFDELKKG